MPTPADMQPPVTPLMLSYTAYEASTNMKTFSMFDAPITLTSSVVPYAKLSTLLHFFQSLTPQSATLVHKNATAVSRSGLALFII